MDKKLRPNKAEKDFLILAYNRFYDIFEEMMEDSFWEHDEWYRFCKIKDAFTVYSELLNYEPIKFVIDWMKDGGRPPMEGEISENLFKFIRNVIIHFPFFESWNQIWVNKSIVNWNKGGQSVDKFLKEYSGKKEIEYRIWEAKKKKMTYLSINFPGKYNLNNKIFLKNIISEIDGIKFCIILMKGILDTQIEKITKNQ